MTKHPQRRAATPDDGEALASDLIPTATPARKPKEPAAAKPKVQAAKAARAASPAQLIARVTRAIERELSQIDDIVGGVKVTPAKRTEAERRARTLASLARTLAEVTRLRAGQNEAKADDDDAVPRDLDEFRRTLERRLAALVDQQTLAADRGDVAG